MDFLLYGFSKSKEISMTYADVTEAVKKLEQLHLSGPTAGRFLGETVASAAILSAELGDKDERISIQIKVDGPVGGSFADVSKCGNLRGYTIKKILNEFDGDKDATLDKIVGNAGELTFIRSNSKQLISQNQVRCDPFNMRHGLARYYNDILNQPTGIEIIALSENFTLSKAVAIKVSRTSSGDPELFIPILEKFNDGMIKNALSQGLDIDTISKMIGLDDLEIIEHRTLNAKCTCSKEKVLYSISCLPKEELREILEKKEIPEVTCHFCSTTYNVSTEEVANIFRKTK